MNDFSVQPVKEHLLELAEIRLQNHPGMFQMLKHNLATGSPRALMISDCLVPGEWVYSLKVSRDFSSINAKLIRAIDSWVNSRPTSKTVVVPLPAPYLPVGEPLAEVSEAPAHAPATVNQVQPATWHLHEPIRDDGLAQPLFIKLKEYRDAGQAIPTPQQVLSDWSTSQPPEITEVTKTGLKYIPTGTARGDVDIPGLRKRICNLTDPKQAKKLPYKHLQAL